MLLPKIYKHTQRELQQVGKYFGNKKGIEHTQQKKN